MSVLELGSSPVDESCAQLGEDGYDDRARLECRAYIAQLKRAYSTAHNQELPSGARLRIKSSSHDFGSYFEVAVSFNDADQEGVNAAYWLEANCPLLWDNEAKEELRIA